MASSLYNETNLIRFFQQSFYFYAEFADKNRRNCTSNKLFAVNISSIINFIICDLLRTFFILKHQKIGRKSSSHISNEDSNIDFK